MSVLEFTPPRVMHVPELRSTAGQEAVELAALAGLELDPWQAYVLEAALAEADDGRWAAADVGLCVPRQNGKNAVLEARELAGLFLLGEQLIIHSAQHFKTSKEHFLRLLGLIENTPDLSKRVKRVIRAHGEEGLELVSGQRILFFARSKSSGRGFSADLVVFDEAMFLAEASLGALIPTQSARPNRQRWYAGSAVDQLLHADGLVFARVRDRALSGEESRLAWFEWSLDAEKPELIDPEVVRSDRAWAEANPGLGIRISSEAVGDELRALDPRTFAVERLGVGDWPDTSPGGGGVINLAAWNALIDEASELLDPVCFAFDVSPDHANASIAAAGRRLDGLLHVEILPRLGRGTGWVIPELARLRAQWNPIAIHCDAVGPAAALIHRCDEAGFDVDPVNSQEHTRACGLLVDLVDERGLRHLGTDELTAALQGATRRSLGDAWAWSRKNSTIDISPLVAATLALWGASTLGWDPNSDPVIY